MHILVVGRGWTGKKVISELIRRGHFVTVTSHHNVFSLLATTSFDWVVNCAGVTGTPNVDACELDKEGTMQGNAIFPIRLFTACQEKQIRLSHFSSGCIYEGTITDVNAHPNFFGSVYSISKGISDIYLGDVAQVYRIRMPFTGIDEPKNYLTKVLRYANTGKLIDTGYNSLTDLHEAITVACDLIESAAGTGYYNLVNSGAITMHELVDMCGLSVEWFTADEFKSATVAARSTCTIPAYVAMRPIHEALRDALAALL